LLLPRVKARYSRDIRFLDNIGVNSLPGPPSKPGWTCTNSAQPDSKQIASDASHVTWMVGKYYSHFSLLCTVLGSISNTSIWNTYLKYIFVFCILHLKYMLNVFVFCFSSKKYKIHFDVQCRRAEMDCQADLSRSCCF